MTCLSCISSIRNPDGRLWCQLGDKECPTRKCVMFTYEPGTDEVEVMA